MKASDFIRMVDRCKEAYDVNSAFVCVAWHGDDYHPISMIDGVCLSDKSSYVVVGSERLTNSEYCGPTQFYARKRPYREREFYGITMTFDKLESFKTGLTTIYKDDIETMEVKFLIATTSDGYPQNIIGDINPHRTEMIENLDGTKLIVFHWDTRDSGEGPVNSAEMKFSSMKSFIKRKSSFDSLNADCETSESIEENSYDK